MSLSRVKTWSAGEVLTAADLNAEFNNILNNPVDLWSPAAKAVDMNGFEVILDADADTSITSDTDDQVDLKVGGTDLFRWKTVASAVNGFDVFAAATGSGPSIVAFGSDTNISATLSGKGTGHIILGQATTTDVRLAADQPVADSSGNELVKFVKTASAVNELTVTNAVTGNAPSLSATGDDSNISLNLVAKGTGVVQAGGVPVVTTTGTQTLTNKTLTSPTVNTATISSPTISGGTVSLITSLSSSTVGPVDAQATLHQTTSTQSGVIFKLLHNATANSNFKFIQCYSDADSANDLEFSLSGDGNGTCDGSWTGGGADYAEFFEWEDGNNDNEDRAGWSVALIGNKIRRAINGDMPIGVISVRPSALGDAAWSYWNQKYLKDDFGRFVMEEYVTAVDGDGDTVHEGIIQKRKKLNPKWNKDYVYIPRSERKEWAMVGLVGKLRVLKGEVTDPRWTKMREISSEVDEWFIR